MHKHRQFYHEVNPSSIFLSFSNIEFSILQHCHWRTWLYTEYTSYPYLCNQIEQRLLVVDILGSYYIHCYCGVKLHTITFDLFAAWLPDWFLSFGFTNDIGRSVVISGISLTIVSSLAPHAVDSATWRIFTWILSNGSWVTFDNTWVGSVVISDICRNWMKWNCFLSDRTPIKERSISHSTLDRIFRWISWPHQVTCIEIVVEVAASFWCFWKINISDWSIKVSDFRKK